MSTHTDARSAALALRNFASHAKAQSHAMFFRTGKGEYGEGDLFIGVTVPNTRKVAKQFAELGKLGIAQLLRSKIHEDRLLAVIILEMQFAAAAKIRDRQAMTEIKEFYLQHKSCINNWDLVDASAGKILGRYFLLVAPNQAKILKSFARSARLWERRIAIIATQELIRAGELDLTFAIAKMLLHDQHDLIHKATGWMLREAGQREPRRLHAFLQRYARTMPRTMLRYSIEKFTPRVRQSYLKRK